MAVSMRAERILMMNRVMNGFISEYRYEKERIERNDRECLLGFSDNRHATDNRWISESQRWT